MFKQRQQEYRRSLVERARPHLADEEPRVFAIAQGTDPRLYLGSIALAVVLINGSLVGDDNYLPTWAAWIGVALVVAASGSGFFRRRFLVRTDERIYMFELPLRRQTPVEPPLATADVIGLPKQEAGKRAKRFGGEKLWPAAGSNLDRDALTEALMPATPSS